MHRDCRIAHTLLTENEHHENEILLARVRERIAQQRAQQAQEQATQKQREKAFLLRFGLLYPTLVAASILYACACLSR